MKKLYLLVVALLFIGQTQGQTYTLGSGTTSISTNGITPFGTYYKGGRIQYIYLASEMTNAGATAGNYVSLAFNITSLGGPDPSNVNVKMAATSATTLSGFDTATNMTTVYSASTLSLVTGWNTLTFSTPFSWNGTSNILVEVCFTDTSWTSNFGVQSQQFGTGARKTYGFYEDVADGCALDATTGNVASAANRRYRPNLQITKAADAAPDCASGFSIADAATGIGRNASLSWDASPGATSYKIYFGAASNPSLASTQSGLTYTPPVMAPNSTYHYKVVPTNAIGDATGCAERTFTTGTDFDYCPSVGKDLDGIAGVTFNNMSNTGTGLDAYTDYTGLFAVDLLQGLTYSGANGLSVYVNTGGSWTNYQSVYIDWNHDGDFDDAGEFYDLGTANDVSNGLSSLAPLSITVPGDAAVGTTRMRVQSKYNGATGDACANDYDGETEDYAINVSAVSAPAISALGATSGCVGSNITILGSNLLGATAADVTIGGTPVDAIVSNDGSTLVATIGSGTTGVVSVTTPGGSATSGASFTVNPLPVITSQPVAPATACGGTNIINLSVAAANAASYQWRREGVNLSNTGIFSGADTASLTLTNALDSDSGAFDVVVTSADGCSVTSDAVTVTVNAAPPSATGATICQGGSGSLTSSTDCGSGYYIPGATISGMWNGTSDPVANRPNSSTNSATCGFSSFTTRKYVQTLFQVSAAGTYTFDMAMDDNFDGMGYLVTSDFTPGNCSGGGTFIKGDDDSGADNEPQLTVDLVPGVLYKLITTTWDNISSYSGPFQWNVSGAGTLLTYGPASVEWYTAASGGTAIGSGSSFDPVGVAGSGIADNNATGVYTFYAACSINPDCRSAATFTILENVTYYADNDSDGYGNPAVSQVSCMGAPSGYVADNTDCDDSDDTLHRTFDFYVDADGDGYGAGDIMAVCAASATSAPAGYAVPGTDCDDTLASVHPGATEIGYNLIDDDCDGLIDEGFPPKQTTISSGQCNTMLPSIDTPLIAGIVSGAQGYRWKITTMSGPNPGEVQEIDTPLRVLRLTQLAGYAFDATYKVEVAVHYAGYVQPYQPSNCTVSTPAAHTQLGNCNQQLTNMSDGIYAYIVPFATGYKFRITDPLVPSHTQEIARPIRDVRLTMVDAFTVQYGKTYNVEVAVRNTDGSYMPYGSVCTVSTPVFPTVSLGESQCDGYALTSANEMVYAESFPGAIKYVFRLSGPGISGYQEITRPLRNFNLNMFSGWIATNTYDVSVRLVFNQNDPEGPFGKVCTIVAPGLSRVAHDKGLPFDAVAYPNPYADTFGISVTGASGSTFDVAVYDMTGRLLEQHESKTGSDVRLGESYPTGIYNVVVSEGDQVKTLRVIKR